MKLNKMIVLGGLILLIGAGCQTAVTEEPEQAVMQEDLTNSENMEVSDETTMTFEHPGVLDDERIKDKQIRISTEKGDIVFTLFADTAPLAVSNYVHLAEQGYYNGLIFHRVEQNFVIQGGDPLGTGRGGPGYRFEDELGPSHIPEDLQDRMDADPDKALYQKGIVAMANSGPNTNGSQFFIMLDNIPSANMPNLYTIFGEVTEGLSIVDEIEVGDIMTTVTVEDAE